MLHCQVLIKADKTNIFQMHLFFIRMYQTNISTWMWGRHGLRLPWKSMLKQHDVKCMPKFILWPFFHVVNVRPATDTRWGRERLHEHRAKGSWHPVGRRHADLWCDSLLEAGSPSHCLFLSSPPLCCLFVRLFCSMSCLPVVMMTKYPHKHGKKKETLDWASLFYPVKQLSSPEHGAH